MKFERLISHQIYKVGQNNVLGLDLLWVHHRVDSLRCIARHPLGWAVDGVPPTVSHRNFQTKW